MRTIKPLRIGLLPKVYEAEGQCRLCVSLLAFFPFDPPDLLLPEMSLWMFVADKLGTEVPLDECMPKPHGELLVVGSAYAPGGKARPVCKVRVQLGALDKSLYVVGDRHWERGGAPSEPEPFAAMPIDWAHAFGGQGYERNPLGKGFVPVARDDGTLLHPLPNVEDPKHVVSSPKDRPEPAGLRAYELTWPQRLSKAGTYDEQWLRELFPGFPRDMDWTFFNVAPPDQWLPGFFRGDETLRVENMHPERPIVESRLPGIQARCFVNQRVGEQEVLREIEMRLDTVLLFPDAERGVLFFRGVVEVLEDDAADVLQIVAACEELGVPRPRAHYEQVLRDRTDPQKRHLFLLRDGDLVPAKYLRKCGLPDEKLGITEDLLAREGLLEANLWVKAELQLTALREEVRRRGIDPAACGVPEKLPEPPPLPAVEELPEYCAAMSVQFEQLEAQAKQQQAEAEAEARARCQEAGIDYDEAVAKAREEAAGPPKFRAADELAKLRDQAESARRAGDAVPELEAKLAQPSFAQKFATAEQMMLWGYRKWAHVRPAASVLTGEAADRTRQLVAAARRQGESLAGRDLTGADLSRLDLRGADFREALLEAVCLAGADLRGADFSGACLARANLTEALLAGARFTDANLGSARLCGAVAAEAVDLGKATLAKADLTGASLKGALLTGADLSEITVAGTCLDAVIGEKLIFMKADLRGASFAGAKLDGSVFLEANVAGVDFSQASLVGAALVETKADGACFREAVLTNFRAVKETSFEGADLRGVQAETSNWRGCNLQRCRFDGARLDHADLSESDARAASFRAASAVEALFIRTDLRGADLTEANLMQSLLQKANIRGADFRGANLFRADFARIRGDEATRLGGANTKQIRFVKRHEDVR
ncbi:MAG: DUF2169 domain-containing protein [Deltaproteobacteria bacterium]|nr:DUF2169 domain-containing protein [Deltaproteobacteria bacterium]